MTREEYNIGVLQDLKSAICDNLINDPIEKEIKQALDMAIQTLEQEPKWISVSEKLPGMNETVLVTDDGEAYFEEHGEGWGGQVTTIAYMTEEGWKLSDINYDCQMNKITAWMPLPEPYKKGE